MKERITSPKPKRVSQRVVGAAAALALVPMAGCSQPSPEQEAMEAATRQVFADVIAGKAASIDPFAGNTFTISLKDAYPKLDMNNPKGVDTAVLYTYQTGEERMYRSIGIDSAPSVEQTELATLAACDTAALNGQLTGEQLKTAQGQWDYFQQLGGQEEVTRSGQYGEAYTAIEALGLTCMHGVGQALRNGEDVTFVPATNG